MSLGRIMLSVPPRGVMPMLPLTSTTRVAPISSRVLMLNSVPYWRTSPLGVCTMKGRLLSLATKK